MRMRASVSDALSGSCAGGNCGPCTAGSSGTGIAFRAGASAESRLSAETGSTSVSTRAGFAAAL